MKNCKHSLRVIAFLVIGIAASTAKQALGADEIYCAPQGAVQACEAPWVMGPGGAGRR